MTKLQPTPERDAHRRWLLRYFASKTPAALVLMMHDASPGLAVGAARLLLDGHEFGAWRARPGDLALARKLTSTKSARKAQSMTTVKSAPLTWSDLGGTPETLKAALETQHHLRSVLDDPHSTPRVKVAAIAAWVEALDAAGLGDIFPDDLRALYLTPKRAIKKEVV